MPTIASRLKALRQTLGWTQVEMSATTGIPLPTWKKYEGSDRDPGAEALVAMATSGVNLHWLLTGKGSMLLGSSPVTAYRVAEPAVDWPQNGAALNVDALTAIIRGLEDAEVHGGGRIDPAKKSALIASAYLDAVAPTTSAKTS
jgi:transcriptional regulator with XRE-family HTH domain